MTQDPKIAEIIKRVAAKHHIPAHELERMYISLFKKVALLIKNSDRTDYPVISVPGLGKFIPLKKYRDAKHTETVQGE